MRSQNGAVLLLVTLASLSLGLPKLHFSNRYSQVVGWIFFALG